MKRFLSLLLSLSLLLTLTAHAAPADNEPWNRMEPGGRYITLRLDYPQGEDSLRQDSRYYYARYADTKEPIPLTSPYLDGALYVTVPTGQEERPMEVLQGDPVKFLDCYTTWMENGTLKKAYANAPLGADVLNLRGLFLGDEKGNLRPEQVLTRAEAFTVLLRLLGADLSAGDDTAGFRDVSPDDWFFPTAMAARRLGLTNEPDLFRPTDAVSRGEFTVMLHRAMKAIGWLEKEFDDVELTFRDAADLPDWAREAYEGLAPYRVQIRTQVDSDIMGEYGPEQDFYAEHSLGATRREVVEVVYDALRWIPWYPTQAAIDLGFDQAMPTVDGSTSTYPYTQAVYAALFLNAENHPNYPARHSKSYASYEALIQGDADLLFIASKPTRDILDRAEAAGVELEFIPIAYDAMVFFSNGENPVEGLTSVQIKDIYVNNAVSNWTELGGSDAALIPYCRNADSGSQALMEEFFLESGDIHPDIRRETTSRSMESVLTDVWQAGSGDPTAYALGYSIYYYYQTASRILLSGEDDLKLLAIDGVFPTDETIADGTYPLSGYNYVALRADQPEHAPARRLCAFLLTEAGQNCVVRAGFGALRPSAQDYLATLTPENVTGVNWIPDRKSVPTTAQVVALLNAAANGTCEAPTGTEAMTLWTLELQLPPSRWSVTDGTLTLHAGLAENKVRITGSEGLPLSELWVEDETLYDLVRTCMDTPDGPIDTAAYAKYQSAVDALIADLPTVTGLTVQQELNAFYLLAENGDLNAQVYQMSLLRTTDPPEKAWVLLAGGQYLDSRLRIHGDTVSCLVTVDGEAVGLWHLDGSEGNDPAAVQSRLASYATKADLLATLDRGRTETFTFGKLKVEVSHVLAVRTEEKLAEGIQSYEETVFTCTPGATLTVVDPDLDDPAYTEDHAAHPNWGLYDFETDTRLKLTGGMDPIVLDETTDCLFDLESGIALLSFEFVE